MALINRISRLLKADFHAVLDNIEEPEQLLKQAIRDMEDDLVSTEQRISLREHDQDALAVRVCELEDAIQETNTQLDLCFDSNKTDLAKSLIRKKLEAERILKRLNNKRAANDKFLNEQRDALKDNCSVLENLRQKAALFSERAANVSDSPSEFDDIAWMAGDLNVSDDEIEIAYLHEQEIRAES